MEIAAVRDVVLISLPDDVIDKVCQKNQFLLKYTIEKGTYAKQDQPCKTVADANFLVVNGKMSDQVAYDCLKIFVEKREEIKKEGNRKRSTKKMKMKMGKKERN